jgi:dephospho-CoA kinase
MPASGKSEAARIAAEMGIPIINMGMATAFTTAQMRRHECSRHTLHSFNQEGWL